MHVPTKIFAK